MKAERLFRAIGLVDEDLIETAAETPVKKRPVWRRYAAAAACLMVLCGAGAAYLVTGGFHDHGASAGGSGINNAGSTADALTFMSYAGPVLPLTTAEETPGVTAERRTDWNFTPRTDPEGYDSQWGAAITDGFILGNPTDTDVTLTLVTGKRPPGRKRRRIFRSQSTPLRILKRPRNSIRRLLRQ